MIFSLRRLGFAVVLLSGCESESADVEVEAGHDAAPAAPSFLDAGIAYDAAQMGSRRPWDASASADGGLYGSERAPCCAADPADGSVATGQPLSGCVTRPGDGAQACAVGVYNNVSSTSDGRFGRLLAGKTYKATFHEQRELVGDPISLDVFGSDQACERKQLLFSFLLDGRPEQSACFTPTQDVDYLVTRVQVGLVSFNQSTPPLLTVCEGCP